MEDRWFVERGYLDVEDIAVINLSSLRFFLLDVILIVEYKSHACEIFCRAKRASYVCSYSLLLSAAFAADVYSRSPPRLV